MRECANCGNKYDKAFSIKMNGQEQFFDSFECAINTLAPRCEHCETRIIGHGVEAEGSIYCCAHCAKHKGHFLVDRPPQEKLD
ncbi:hypothetical protein [Pseudobdellovibrio exovorus]|uniref:Metallothionein n=1 Tax=Pseudobdellovibrio exovorus JSS TaxID=1184267 RepID=M4VQG4_9BACT|nr:hypothetical protein [Pseudobdellovibrio exovorus]AGH95399.1 hypothetical protein A11Q_1183 [Pseudobdellovibrio exovorus JSS]